ncbi:MAG: hypothetical protein Q8N91_04410 [Candidatus Omnitrophota bacterium]|nr:hypothetical protein [Candidatus Omnitrophota bacterium]
MFKIVNQDILLRLKLTMDRKSYSVVNICGAQDAGQIVLKLRSDEGGGLATSVFLADAAEKYSVDNTGKTLGQWLDEEFLGAESCLENIVDAYADADGAPRLAGGDGMAQASKTRALLNLGAIRTLGNRSRDEVLSHLKSWLDADRHMWQTRKVGMDKEARSESIDIIVMPTARLEGLFLELKKARAEAEARSVSLDGVSIRFEPFLCRALERHWTEVLRGVDIIRAMGRSDSGGMRVDAQIREASPPADIAHSKINIARTFKHGKKDAVSESAEPRKIRISAVTDGYKTDIAIELFFSVAASKTFAARIITHCGISRLNPKKIVKQLKAGLEGYLSDMQWALDKYFKDNMMSVASYRGMVFQDIDEFKKWLGASSNADDYKICRLGSAEQKGGPRILSRENPADIIAEWLQGIAAD